MALPMKSSQSLDPNIDKIEEVTDAVRQTDSVALYG